MPLKELDLALGMLKIDKVTTNIDQNIRDLEMTKRDHLMLKKLRDTHKDDRMDKK